MATYSCIFRTFPWFAVIGFIFLAFSQSGSGFGFVTVFLTSSAMILCPVIVCRTKSTAFIQETSVISSEEVSAEQILHQKHSPQNESRICMTATKKKDENMLSSSDSESSCRSSIDQTTFSSEEYSENDWIFRDNMSHMSCSDGSISDEESLIEIALPTGHYVESKSTVQQQEQQQKSWKCCSLETHFIRQQNTWMEMLNEMNEENFIEIDLCMGSIKCSRFEIQA